jgi:hypothetical protein
MLGHLINPSSFICIGDARRAPCVLVDRPTPIARPPRRPSLLHDEVVAHARHRVSGLLPPPRRRRPAPILIFVDDDSSIDDDSYNFVCLRKDDFL